MMSRLLPFALVAAFAWLFDQRTRFGLPGPVERNAKYQALVRGRREYRVGKGLLFSTPLPLLFVAPSEGSATVRTVAVVYMAFCLAAYAGLFIWSAEKCGVRDLEMRAVKKANRRRRASSDKASPGKESAPS